MSIASANRTGRADVSPPADKNETDAVLDGIPRILYLNDSRTIFAGGLRVWRTKDDGNNWLGVSPVLDGSAISAVEIAQANSKIVFVGTEKGGIYRSTDGGNTWSEDLSESGASRIYYHAHPHQSDQCTDSLRYSRELPREPRFPLEGWRDDVDGH